MALTTGVKKITKSKPFYALAGAVGYAVETLRKAPKQLQARQSELRGAARNLPGRARKSVAKDLPEQTREYADTTAAKVNKFYDKLAARGRKIVSRASHEAAHELEEVSESAQPATVPRKRTTPAGKPAPRPARRARTTSKA
jgi:CO dehydrogenase/acetyl-CoA synthase beta subunit